MMRPPFKDRTRCFGVSPRGEIAGSPWGVSGSIRRLLSRPRRRRRADPSNGQACLRLESRVRGRIASSAGAATAFPMSDRQRPHAGYRPSRPRPTTADHAPRDRRRRIDPADRPGRQPLRSAAAGTDSACSRARSGRSADRRARRRPPRSRIRSSASATGSPRMKASASGASREDPTRRTWHVLAKLSIRPRV